MNFNRSQRGFSLIELLIVVVIIGIVASIAVPNLLASRRSANEASALGVLRKVSSAEISYFAGAGNYGFASAAELYSHQLIGKRTAAALNLNVGGTPPRNNARDGYRYRIQSVDRDPSAGVESTFVISANPATITGPTQTGAKRYCLTEDGIIRSSTQNLNSKYNYAQCGFANAFEP